MEHTRINYKGNKIDCYGTMQEDAAIDVLCDNESEDGTVAEGFNNWTLAVRALVDSGKFPGGIVELQSDFE